MFLATLPGRDPCSGSLDWCSRRGRSSTGCASSVLSAPGGCHTDARGVCDVRERKHTAGVPKPGTIQWAISEESGFNLRLRSFLERFFVHKGWLKRRPAPAPAGGPAAAGATNGGAKA